MDTSIEDKSGEANVSFILQNFYDPKKDSVLYHYCSMESFEAIVRSGRIRLSDINMMNDFSEISWGYKIFEEAASRILAREDQNSDLPNRDFFDAIDAQLASAQLSMHPLLACFSTERDVLSQWRGYANDGTGVCIGFSGHKLLNCCATFFKCQYDYEIQVEQMIGRLISAYQIGSEFSPQDHAEHLFGYLPSLKNPAFIEEGEVRAVHLLQVSVTENGFELTDPGGQEFGKDAAICSVEFQIRDGGVVPYIDIPFYDGKPDGEITNVTLGPKNVNFPGNISAMLMRYGYKKVTILRSQATYR